MKKRPFPRVTWIACTVMAAAIAACTASTRSPQTEPATLQQDEIHSPVPPTASPEPTPQPLVFVASDAPLDCFNGFAEPHACDGLDLLELKIGLQDQVLGEPNAPIWPVIFLVTFADPVETAQGFSLYLYLDVDQDPNTGLDMSSGPIALTGIDRLVGVNLPDASSWTQNVAAGGYEAEVVDDERVSAQIEGNQVIVSVGRAILDERAPMVWPPAESETGTLDKNVSSRPHSPYVVGSMVAIGFQGRVLAAGGAPNAFTLYIGTIRGTSSLDYFTTDQQPQVPVPMIVPEEVMNPPGPVGGS